MPERKITNLVFQGGSVKGAAYVGVLQALEELIDVRQLRSIAGTSAGSITATLLAVAVIQSQ